MDLIGPLERSACGHRFALVLVDYTTRYPEAVPLCTISAKSVADALFRIISRVGIPKEIWPGHGVSVTYAKRTVWILGIKSIRTSVYHPKTDGLVERFNRTLKSMVHKFVKEEAKNWDKWLEPLLFAVWEVPQASTGFSPFKLLYGRQPRGVLDVIRESNSHSEIQYVMDLRAKLHTLGRLSMENLLQAQDRQSRLYNRGTRKRQFTPGDKVLVLLPTSSSKLLTKWQFAAVCWCVFTPAWSYGPHTAPYRNAPRGGGAQPSLPITRTQKKSGSGGIKGYARVGGNRRIA